MADSEVINFVEYRSRDSALAAKADLMISGGGGTLPPVDVMDAKIAAAEARTDTKFEALRADLKDFATKNTVWGAMVTGVATTITIGLAVAAFSGNRFDAGLNMADHRQTQLVRDAEQDEAVKRIETKIDELISAQSGGAKSK